MECSTCKQECFNKRRAQIRERELFGASCDFCRKFFCKNCLETTVTENDCLVLTQRKLAAAKSAKFKYLVVMKHWYT